MSEFRFEKQRVPATLTLAVGTSVRGSFFVAAQTSGRAGRELVGDVLNAHTGFFPFELHDGSTVLYSRAHVVTVALDPPNNEASEASGYEVAPKYHVAMVLSTGMRVNGTVAVYCLPGHDRLSDYARTPEMFRYLVTPRNTLLVNTNHIVELTEMPD